VGLRSARQATCCWCPAALPHRALMVMH
jgi:hypothetical protein